MSKLISYAMITVLLILVSACGKSDSIRKDKETKAVQEESSGLTGKPSQGHTPSKATNAGQQKQDGRDQIPKGSEPTITQGQATAGSADVGPSGDAKRGATVYGTYCVACHQKDGKGMGGALAADFVNDTSRLAKSDAVLLSSIANGVKGKTMIMPPQKEILSKQQMKDVLAFIRATFGTKPSS